MKKLFVYHPLFRLLSPLFSGTLVYLLILLINNNIVQLQETFLGQELYVCIGLAYLIQEFSRFSLLFFRNLKRPKSIVIKTLVQVITSIVLTIVLVSGAMYLYFVYVLSYSPNIRELYIFNVIFVFVTLLYVTLFLSHYFLYKINTDKTAKEVLAKNAIEEDFLQFKKGVNPALLFESLEAMIVIMKDDPNEAEEFSDYFSSVYRYILSKQNRELVRLSEELNILEQLVLLFNHLPYRKIEVNNKANNSNWVLPTSLLTLVESIIRTTIVSEKHVLNINIDEDESFLKVSYGPEERLNFSLSNKSIGDVRTAYSYYTDVKPEVFCNNKQKSINLPKLIYDENSHN